MVCKATDVWSFLTDLMSDNELGTLRKAVKKPDHYHPPVMSLEIPVREKLLTA
jgi:hypothetical protein